MVKVTWRLYEPSDPIYKEGYQRYSPHWGRAFLGVLQPASDWRAKQ